MEKNIDEDALENDEDGSGVSWVVGGGGWVWVGIEVKWSVVGEWNGWYRVYQRVDVGVRSGIGDA